MAFPLPVRHPSWKLAFSPESPQVLPGWRPEAGELVSLWSRRTAMPRETPACQLPPASTGSIPQSPAQGEGRRIESQVMSLSQTPLPVLSVSWCPRERGVISCPSSPSLPAPFSCFPRQRRGEAHISRRGLEAGGGPHPFMLTLEPPSHPSSLMASSHVRAP